MKWPEEAFRPHARPSVEQMLYHDCIGVAEAISNNEDHTLLILTTFDMGRTCLAYHVQTKRLLIITNGPAWDPDHLGQEHEV